MLSPHDDIDGEILSTIYFKHEKNWSQIENDEEFKSLNLFRSSAKEKIRDIRKEFTSNFMKSLEAENKDMKKIEKDLQNPKLKPSYVVNFTNHHKNSSF